MSNSYISLCKIPSHNLNSVYSNFLTNEIDFCFPKLYSSQLIRTQIEYVNKLDLIILIKLFGSQRRGKYGQVHELVINKHDFFNNNIFQKIQDSTLLWWHFRF